MSRGAPPSAPRQLSITRPLPAHRLAGDKGELGQPAGARLWQRRAEAGKSPRPLLGSKRSMGQEDWDRKVRVRRGSVWKDRCVFIGPQPCGGWGAPAPPRPRIWLPRQHSTQRPSDNVPWEPTNCRAPLPPNLRRGGGNCVPTLLLSLTLAYGLRDIRVTIGHCRHPHTLGSPLLSCQGAAACGLRRLGPELPSAG